MAIEGYDLVMLGIVAAAAVLGYLKGIVWQVAWIAGIALSSYVAIRFGGPLAPFFGQQPPWNRLFAMLALYVATSLVVWLGFGVVSGVLNAVHLSAFDHQLGLLLGLAKGVLICIVVTFFSVTLAPGYRDQIVASRSGRLVAEVIVRADELLPRDVAETVQPFIEQFEEQLRRPAGAPAPAGRPPRAADAGRPSPLQAIWEGVTSTTAWTGTGRPGQGPGQPTASPVAQPGWPPAAQPGFPRGGPPGSNPVAQPGVGPGGQPGFQTGFHAAPQAAAPVVQQAWPQQPWPPQAAPAAAAYAQPPSYPIGAQSPLPYR